MLVMVLKAEGWVVAEAASGDEALERCRHESFDVAVLDYMMPGMNGLQVARSLRSEGIRLPTILFTAYLVDELKTTCDDLGVVAVDKINWDELVLRCRELWEKRAEARSYASSAVRRSRLLCPVGVGGQVNSPGPFLDEGGERMNGNITFHPVQRRATDQDQGAPGVRTGVLAGGPGRASGAPGCSCV